MSMSTTGFFTLACPATWGNDHTRCRYWSNHPGVHGCNLDPGHQGEHQCGCGRHHPNQETQ